MILSVDQLKHIAPACRNAQAFTDALNKYMGDYQINTKARMAAFLANVCEESGEFKYTKELASGAAYEGRKDLGNIQIGDGMKFAGKGLLQITGRTNYGAVSQYMFKDARLLDNPELLEQPDHATESACWFWSVYKQLNEIADMPEGWIKEGIHHYTKQEWICVKINGGLTNFKKRMDYLNAANEVL